MAFDRADGYRKQAAECEAQAERSKFQRERDERLKLEAAWLKMAEEAEKASTKGRPLLT
jgi:hypothetical protein